MPTDLAAIAENIRTEMVTLVGHHRNGAEAACRIGRYLIDARKALATDQTFQAWVKENCSFSYPSACRYVKLANNWGSFTEEMKAEYPINHLLSLLKGKARKPKNGKKTPGRASVVTAERVGSLIAQHGISGDVDAFLAALGVRVKAAEAKKSVAKKVKLAA